MLKSILSRKGQNMAEYAIIFGVVIAAAVGISALIKQGIQTRVASEISKIGETATGNIANVLDIVTNTTRNTTGNENITVAVGGATNEQRYSNATINAQEGYTVGKGK